MLECLKKLNGVDQVILRCWMVYPKGEYTDMAIEELGWDDNKRTRNVVNVRCNRAITTSSGGGSGLQERVSPPV